MCYWLTIDRGHKLFMKYWLQTEINFTNDEESDVSIRRYYWIFYELSEEWARIKKPLGPFGSVRARVSMQIGLFLIPVWIPWSSAFFVHQTFPGTITIYWVGHRLICRILSSTSLTSFQNSSSLWHKLYPRLWTGPDQSLRQAWKVR